MIENYHDIAIFKYLSDSECELIKSKVLFVRKKTGEAIALSGEPVVGIYIVIKGEVGVYPPGSKKPFSTLKPGTAFGEMSFLDGSKASATIRTEKPETEVACISYQLLQTLLKDSPQLAAGMYRGIAVSLAQKLRTTNEKISSEVAETHKQLIQSQLGKPADGASVIEKLSAKTAAQMSELSAKLNKLSIIAAQLTRSVPEKASEINALGGEIDNINLSIKNSIDDFKSQMASLHHFVSAVERSIHL